MDFIKFTNKLEGDSALIESIQRGYIALHEGKDFNDMMDAVYETDFDKLIELKKRGYEPSLGHLEHAMKILERKHPEIQTAINVRKLKEALSKGERNMHVFKYLLTSL